MSASVAVIMPSFRNLEYSRTQPRYPPLLDDSSESLESSPLDPQALRVNPKIKMSAIFFISSFPLRNFDISYPRFSIWILLIDFYRSSDYLVEVAKELSVLLR
jgi:hypothetical protein